MRQWIASIRKTTAVILCALTAVILSCVSLEDRYLKEPASEQFVIWALSDIQPRNKAERIHFETAISDVVKNFPAIDAAIVAGDIAQERRHSDADEEFEWFLSARKPAQVRAWYEIAGNHDARNLESYRAHIGKPLHYAVFTGNLLMIFLSDEIGRTSGQEVSEGVFEWWKDLVEKNQDKIIITVTHTHLAHVGFTYAIVNYRNVEHSEKYEAVLRQNRVDLWLCGHTHMPSSYGFNDIDPKDFKTRFINISSIRKDYRISHIESRLILLRKGSDKFIVLTRYHDKGEFRTGIPVEFRLSKPFIWDGSESIMKPYTGKTR